MQKVKIVIGLLVAVAIITALVFAYRIYNQRVQSQGNVVAANETKEENKIEEKVEPKEEQKGIAVVYFSATGTTKKVAEYASQNLNAELIEIIPKQAYTKEDLEYNNDESRATKEQNEDEARPEIKEAINLEDYDTILLGYPIWWGKAPKIILTLIDSGSLDEKTIIPFCTSGSSDIGGSVQELKKYTSKMKFLESDARRFGSNVSKEEVSSWINSLNLEKGE